MILLTLLLLSTLGVLVYGLKLSHGIDHAPQIFPEVCNTGDHKAIGFPLPPATARAALPRMAIIVPVYNEARNIEGCLRSLLDAASTINPPVEVWLVDDQSTDNTLAIAQALQQDEGTVALHILVGQDRPSDRRWVGKNWACTQGAAQVNAEFLLFLDADVRLKPGALEAALEVMEREQIDLLTCLPSVVCEGLAEWVVQPLMAALLFNGFAITEVNDPNSTVAFATGPFMLFRRSAYEHIGGHQAVADQVVEDVELARLIKSKGLRLRYALGLHLASIQMYESGAALWEGWTKNLYPGAQRRLISMMVVALGALLLYTVPWVGFLLALAQLIGGTSSELPEAVIALALLTISLHYWLRRVIQKGAGIPPRYWWLTAVGGVGLAGIAIASVIKTETGWGWTWRGRALKPG